MRKGAAEHTRLEFHLCLAFFLDGAMEVPRRAPGPPTSVFMCKGWGTLPATPVSVMLARVQRGGGAGGALRRLARRQRPVVGVAGARLRGHQRLRHHPTIQPGAGPGGACHGGNPNPVCVRTVDGQAGAHRCRSGSTNLRLRSCPNPARQQPHAQSTRGARHAHPSSHVEHARKPGV